MNQQSSSTEQIVYCTGLHLIMVTPFLSSLQGCKLGPGTYEHKSFTEDISNKVTSVRGPYDLFTGDRNAPVKTGHLAKPVSSLIILIRVNVLSHPVR